jgi:hypothetical protein
VRIRFPAVGLPRADAGGGGNSSAASARKQVRSILDRPQYRSRPERTFRPLRGAIAATGRWFDRVFGPAWRWVDHHLFHPVGRWFTTDIGLSWPVVVLAIALVVGFAIGVIAMRRRARIGFEEVDGGREFEGEDPRRLEELARQAEAAGDLRAAIRLRFRAGVADLDNLGVISRGPTRTTAQIAGVLSSAEFETLAADLEAIVYGGVAATQEQASSARSTWPVVISEAERAIRTNAENEARRITRVASR